MVVFLGEYWGIKGYFGLKSNKKKKSRMEKVKWGSVFSNLALYVLDSFSTQAIASYTSPLQYNTKTKIGLVKIQVTYKFGYFS